LRGGQCQAFFSQAWGNGAAPSAAGRLEEHTAGKEKGIHPLAIAAAEKWRSGHPRSASQHP